MAPEETTPLLKTTSRRSTASSIKAAARWALSPANRTLLAGFIISLSFGFTQVPLFYTFHLMECDAYYETHPPYEGTGDRCSVNEIAAGTALQYSILGMSTTFCGTWNLFISGWQVKRWGPKIALMIQTAIPGIRVLTQVVGVVVGSSAGIMIIQCTQLITILGGPAGYILVVNTIAGEVVPPMERTAVFGKLQGCIMLGQAIAFFLGGKVGDAFGVRRPFEVAFFLFCLSCLYTLLVIPYISPESLSDGKKDKKSSGGFLGPLRILAPQRIRLRDGTVKKHRGVLFLCMGVFLATLATGFAPILVQMYATSYFGFTQANNGWLMAGNSFIRAIFLVFMFPQIIALGRRWYASISPAPKPTSNGCAESAPNGTAEEIAGLLPTRPGRFEAPVASLAEDEPASAEAAGDRAAIRFDLFFLRWSLLLDGLLTSLVALATEGWHVYLAQFLLPFGSGTAPAAKGVITEMCLSSQRTDALNAITLVENIARLATQGLFGFVFSSLAEVGQAHLTFYCNAAVAIIGMAVLYLSWFPPLDATMMEEGEDLNEEQAEPHEYQSIHEDQEA